MKPVLVIEGDTMVRRFLRTALENAQYSVLEASTDDEGVRIAVEQEVCAIVLDCMGTHAGGLRTLKRLRTDARTHAIPVIAMSGLGQYGYDLPLWANACLIKPFRPAQLIGKLRTVTPDAQTDACVHETASTLALSV